jgi:hypothetical protein
VTVERQTQNSRVTTPPVFPPRKLAQRLSAADNAYRGEEMITPIYRMSGCLFVSAAITYTRALKVKVTSTRNVMCTTSGSMFAFRSVKHTGRFTRSTQQDPKAYRLAFEIPRLFAAARSAVGNSNQLCITASTALLVYPRSA